MSGLVWGHSLAFWDRLGQVMEFVGALAVVIDLLGAERLATIASELREWTQDPAMRPTRLLARPSVALIGIAAISIIAGIAISAYLLLVLYFVLFCVVTPPIADYTARILEREHADKWLKVIALPLLTLGFFLDMMFP